MSDQMIVRPSYLPAVDASEIGNELGMLSSFQKPAWIRIVQPMSKAPIKGQGRVDGDIIITTPIQKIGDLNNEFEFSVLGGFPSWAITNPYGADTYIRESTFDPKSELAKLCKLNAGKTVQIEGKECKYVTFLNFVVKVPGFELPLMMGFKGGEFKFGQEFISLLNAKVREFKVKKWAFRFAAHSELHKYKAPNEGYGYSIRLAPEMFIPESEAELMQELSKEVEHLIETRQIELDMEQVKDDGTEGGQF